MQNTCVAPDVGDYCLCFSATDFRSVGYLEQFNFLFLRSTYKSLA